MRRPICGSEMSPAASPVRSTPIALVEREALPHWQRRAVDPDSTEGLSHRGLKILESLRQHGASFFSDFVHDTGLLKSEVEQGLGELVNRGRVSSDSFAGLRALITSRKRRERLRRYRRPLTDVDDAGRWSLPRRVRAPETAEALGNPAADHIARVLLRRYGVVFRKLLERETGLPPWRELFYVYRRMEARGEIRGGSFVCGFSSEQFALPEAVDPLMSVTKDRTLDRIAVTAADPLVLVGFASSDDRVPAQLGNRALFERGVVVACQTAGEVRFAANVSEESQWELRNLLLCNRTLPGFPYASEPRN